MMFLAVTLFGVASVCAQQYNEILLGSAVDISMPKESSTCALKLSVPASVVKPGCKLRIRYDIPPADPKQPTVSFFLKKGGNGEFTDADKKPVTDYQYDMDCEAGDFWFGAKVESCALCVLGANAKFSISFTILQDGNAIVDIGQASEFYSGNFYMTADKYIVHKFTTTTASQIAHFKILKSIGSVFDNLDYFAAPGDKTIADATVAANKLSSTTAIDGNRRIIINATTAGDYLFIIKLASIGNKTELATKFQLNQQPDDLKYDEARCPQVSCTAADYQGCGVCTHNDCNWCGGDEMKCVSGQCVKAENAVVDDDKCPDIDAECRKFEKDCVKCLSAKKGCIYCDTGATFGISSGQCSAGKDGLGKACNTVGNAIKITQKYTEASACPAVSCTSADYQGCKVCTDNDCTWCGGDEMKCVSGQCVKAENAILDEDKCPDSDSQCAFTADEFDPKNPKCLSALESTKDGDWVRFALAAAAGAKSELSVQLCDAFRTFRVCVAREIAFVSSRCPKMVPSVTARQRYQSQTSREIVGTIPTCNEKLTAYVKDIDCNLCDALPVFDFSTAPARVSVPDVIVMLIASTTIVLSI